MEVLHLETGARSMLELAGANHGNGEDPYFGAQIGLAGFYFAHVLPAAAAHAETVFEGLNGIVDGAGLLV